MCIYIYVHTHRKKPIFVMYMFMAKLDSKISTCDPLPAFEIRIFLAFLHVSGCIFPI